MIGLEDFSLGLARMIDTIARLVNADAGLVRRGRFVDTTFLIAIDDADTLVRIQEGRVDRSHAGTVHHAGLQLRAARLARGVGEILAAAAAARLHRHLRADQARKLMRVEGDLHPFMANLLYFKDVIAAPRKEAERGPR